MSTDLQNTESYRAAIRIHSFDDAARHDPEAAILLTHEQLAFSADCPPELSLQALHGRYRHEQPFATPHRDELLVMRRVPDETLLGAASIAIGVLPLARSRIVTMHIPDTDTIPDVGEALVATTLERATDARSSSVEVQPSRDKAVLAMYEKLGFRAVNNWNDKNFTLRKEL